MKKLLMILVSIALILPLYAQEAESTELDESVAVETLNDEGLFEEEDELAEAPEEEEKKPRTYTREKFEFGSSIGIGIDNDFMSMGDLFSKNIVIDLDKVDDILGEDGLNLNFALEGGLFINIFNIPIKEGIWEFGFFIDGEGGISANVPQSLFTLISEGNYKQRSFDGMISASGAVFANTGVRASAQYGKLRLGARPTLFTPIIFVPKSGINYKLETEDKIALTTSGEINVYYPIDEKENFTGLKFGFDMSLEGEYELFSFLDVGGTFSGIPVVPAIVKNRMQLTMSKLEFEIEGKELMEGEDISKKLPDFDKIEFDKSYDIAPHNVFRPLRFDIYANYKPYQNDLLAVIVRPNLGFSVDINNKEGFFNAGAEGQLDIKEIFSVYLGTGCTEAIWNHHLGFILNLRAVAWGVEAGLQSSDFAGSFQAQGFSLSTGISFGW